ncbi:MAG: InlB B-repeat-containing protein [Acidimicrobiales bacterium]
MRQSSSPVVSSTAGILYKLKPLLCSFIAMFIVAVISLGAIPSLASGTTPPFNTASFFQNDSSTDQTYVTQTANSLSYLKSFASISPAFENPGYTFSDWSTTSTPLAESQYFADGAMYGFDSNISLYAQWAPNVYDVTYVAGGGTVTPPSVNYTVGTTPLTLATPTLTGNTFLGWNTAADGSGTSYSAGSPYTPVANVTLYAQWSTMVYTLTYDVQGGSVSPATVIFPFGTSALTLPTPTFIGHAFADWNTVADGSGSSYAAGSLYTPEASLTLYAQWTPDVFTLSYDAAGGTVSPVSANYTVGASALTLVTPQFVGHVFGSWNTSVDGSGTSYAGNATFVPTSSETLYAQWTLVPAAAMSTVSFAPNGATGTIASVTGSDGTSFTLPTADALTYPGFTFAGWNASAQAIGSNYASASIITLSSSLTLYAQWTKMPVYTISFVANGGSGSVTALSGPGGTSMTLPGGIGLTYAGHAFASWNTLANGSGSVFNENGSLQLSSSLTLYAQWDALLVTPSPNVLIGAVGSFAINSASLTANLRIQVMRLALLSRASHFTVETLYGYTNDVGSAASQRAVSARRANVVANFLRAELAVLHVRNVRITSAGEGAFVTGSSPAFRRVEVFVKA